MDLLKEQEIDPALRFLPASDGGLRPVVRVEITTEGDRRTLREFGPDDELLRSTFQIADPKAAGIRMRAT